MLLTIAEYRATPAKIASVLRVDERQLQAIFRNLELVGAIKLAADGSRIEAVSEKRHLDSGHPLTTAHQTLLKIKGLEHCARLDESKRYNMALTFTATDRTRRRLQRAILEMLKEAERLVEAAPAENLYQLNIDLFSWL